MHLLRFCALVLAVVGGVSSAQAQSIEEIAGRKDGRTLRERAWYLMREGGKDSLAMAYYVQWLNAVPKDTAAMRELLELYDRNKRTRAADTLRSALRRFERPSDSRELTMHTLQVTMGSYRVIMPEQVRMAETYPAIVVLHGNGNSPETMMRWARSLKLDSAILIFPQAPYLKIDEVLATHTLRYSASGRGLGFADSVQADLVDASAAWYHDVFLDASTRLPISKDKPLIIGFSQGGFFAYCVAVRYPHVFRSLVTICASMYEYGRVEASLPDLRTHGVDVLVTHGTSDSVVPLQTGELISAMLETAGVDHVFMPFDGGHWPSEEITTVIRDWVRLRLP